jgi:D-alanine-D-alanine ligase
MQRLLDAAGGAYAGCDAAASALTMDKELTKGPRRRRAVAVADGMTFDAGSKPPRRGRPPAGPRSSSKPNNEGSSVGLSRRRRRGRPRRRPGLGHGGRWIVGAQDRRARALRRHPGRLGHGDRRDQPEVGGLRLREQVHRGLDRVPRAGAARRRAGGQGEGAAETAFAACGCRDYARVDFMISAKGEPFLLEINTLPGMKETSLLPMSARCAGLDFTALVREMVSPAVERFR